MKLTSGSIIILVDNVVPAGGESLAEHGFSAYVATKSGNFLFDTGRGKALLHNALVLKVELHKIDKIVLSHNHHDHTGGLPDLLKTLKNLPIDVRAHEDIFLHRFRKKHGNICYKGIPFTQGHLERCGANFVFNKGYTQLDDGIFLTGNVPRKTTFEGGDLGGRRLIRDGREEDDIIPDDQSMVFQTENGLVILLGCAHAGIINILNYVIEKTGVSDIFALLGGTHIGLSGDLQLKETMKALKKFNIKHFVPSHCTGLEAAVRMKMVLPDIVELSHVGYKLNF